MTLQKSVLTDDLTSDHCIGNDREFQVAIIQQLPPVYFHLGKQLFLDSYYSSEHFNFKQGLLDIINLPKSRFTVNDLYKNTAKYLLKPDIPQETAHDVEPETIAMYKKHLIMYETGLKRLQSLPPEDQELIILSGIIPGSNLGYDQFTHGSKRTFKKMLFKYCEKHLGMSLSEKDYLTADLAMDIISACVSKDHNPPFVLFYRTHTYPKVRSIFGSGIMGKLVAAFMAACKKLADDKFFIRVKDNPDGAKEIYAESTLEKEEFTNLKEYLPRVGDLPWLAWLEWDPQFEIIRQAMGNSEDLEWIGTDFTAYDTSIRFIDFDWKLDLKTPFHDVFQFTYNQQKEAETWTNGYRITNSVMDEVDYETDEEGIEFKSGIWSTSEDGSCKHFDLNQKVAKDMGAQIDHSILLSDDDLTAFRKFSTIEDHAKLMASYGFEISSDKTSLFSRDGYVEFLKNHIGYIYSEDDLTVLANLVSRCYGLAHTERSLEKRGIYHVTGDVPVDQGTSKLASIGSQGNPFISETLKVVRGIDLGKKIIAAVLMVQRTPNYRSRLYRSDLTTSYRPEESFKDVRVPSILTS